MNGWSSVLCVVCCVWCGVCCVVSARCVLTPALTACPAGWLLPRVVKRDNQSVLTRPVLTRCALLLPCCCPAAVLLSCADRPLPSGWLLLREVRT
jgi:hypothetical protein